jgi:hypothetical protein
MGKRIALHPRVGYEAEEPQKRISSVLELMLLVCWNKNRIACSKGSGFYSVEKLSFAFQNENFVLPRVRVQGAVSAGSHFEEANGEVLGAHFFGDEPAYCCFCGAFFGVLGFYGVVVEYSHVFAFV